MARPSCSWLSKPLLLRFPFFQTNNLQINGHNYLWPPQLRTTAIKLINRGRLSVSPDCCVIRGAINKAVLLPCDILQMVWQQQLLLLQPLGSIHPHHGRGWVRHTGEKPIFTNSLCSASPPSGNVSAQGLNLLCPVCFVFVPALSNPGQLQKAQQQLRLVPPLRSLGEISIVIGTTGVTA